MPDPVLRRIACAAVVYWEMDPDGPKVSRLIVDVPIPLLEGPQAEDEEVLAEASAALARWLKSHRVPPNHPAAEPVPPYEASTSYGAWEVAA